MKSDLFQLVKSLSQSEKRYFRVARQADRAAAYMRVFDWMEGLETYEEEAAFAEFEGESFLKQFGVLKNYLKEGL